MIGVAPTAMDLGQPAQGVRVLAVARHYLVEHGARPVETTRLHVATREQDPATDGIGIAAQAVFDDAGCIIDESNFEEGRTEWQVPATFGVTRVSAFQPAQAFGGVGFVIAGHELLRRRPNHTRGTLPSSRVEKDSR